MKSAALALAVGIALVSVACGRGDAPKNRDDIAVDATAVLPDSGTLHSPTAADVIVRDTRVLPNAFNGGDTLDSLRARYGASNVRVEDIPGAEGEVTRGVVLFPDDPTRRAYLLFSDAENLQGLALVRVVDHDSTWTLGDLRMGTTLAELVARNGAPIEFSGFGWDYGGAIAGFHGGALEPRDNNWPRTGFRLSPRTDLGEGLLQLPQGDGSFSTDDPKFAQYGTDIVIGELTLAFPRAATQ
jgi:hypothetical protein